MKKYRNFAAFSLAASALVLALAFGTSVDADQLGNEPVFKTRADVAIRGYDTVAYHTENQAIKGKNQFSHEYKGATWLFSSAENRDLFAQDPEVYAPAYNGFCAYAMGSYGGTTRTDPNAFTIRDGVLYLNFNQAVSERFRNDMDGYIAAGGDNWDLVVLNSPANVDEPVFKNNRDLAIRGFDPVSYWPEGGGKPLRGKSDFSHQYKGAIWQFASRENRNLFTANPERYAPAYNGYCAYALGETGELVRVNPRIYTISDGRLYLNFSRAIGNRFEANLENYIAEGEANWEEIIAQ